MFPIVLHMTSTQAVHNAQHPQVADLPEPSVEVSVVMPALNEADTIEACVEKALRALRDSAIVGEVIVADNGSTDGSQRLAETLGARVVHVEARGYGSALMGGIAAARGQFIVMGDADDSYDFLQTPRFVAKLREGFDLVQGCRLPAGRGTIETDAMPFLHRWLGNPLFSLMARRWFKAPIHDVYCGLRGFRKDFQQSLDQQCTGMEFATEMIIKSTFARARITEVPVTLRRDGRKSHTPHLRTFRDGWRTLRFFLLFSPRWLFLQPGLLLVSIGLIGYTLAIPAVKIGPATFDAHTLLFSSLFLLLGYQSVLFGMFTKTFAINVGLLPSDANFERFFRLVNLERGIVLGLGALTVGLGMLLNAVLFWDRVGQVDYARTMRWVIPGATLTALGFQTILSGFFVSILGMKRK